MYHVYTFRLCPLFQDLDRDFWIGPSGYCEAVEGPTGGSLIVIFLYIFSFLFV